MWSLKVSFVMRKLFIVLFYWGCGDNINLPRDKRWTLAIDIIIFTTHTNQDDSPLRAKTHWQHWLLGGGIIPKSAFSLVIKIWLTSHLIPSGIRWLSWFTDVRVSSSPFWAGLKPALWFYSLAPGKLEAGAGRGLHLLLFDIQKFISEQVFFWLVKSSVFRKHI